MRDLTLQFAGVLSSRLAQRILNLLVIVMLARLLTVADYGTYGIFVTTITLSVTLGAMGLQEALAYLIGRRPEKAGTYFGTALFILIPLIAASGSGAIFWLEISSQIEALLWIGPVLFVITGRLLLLCAQGYSLAIKKMRDFNLSEAIPFAILFLGIGGAFLFEIADLMLAVWLYAGAHFAISIIYALKIILSKKFLLRANIKHGIEVLQYGAPYAFSMFLAIANNTAAIYILKAKGLDQAVAFYFIAWQACNAILNISNALGLVLFAHSARSEDASAVLKDTARFASFLFWSMVIVGIVVAILSPVFIPLIFGQSYTDAVPLIQLVMVTMGFASVTRVLYRTIGGLGLPYYSTAFLIPALAINISGSWLLIDIFGQEGAILGLFVSQIFTLICFLGIIKIKFQKPILSFILPTSDDLKLAAEKTRKYVKRIVNTCTS